MPRMNFGGVDGFSWWDFVARNEGHTRGNEKNSGLACATKAKRWPSATIGHFEIPCQCESKRILVQKLSYETEFDLHENELVEEARLHMNGFAQTHVDTEARGNSEMTYVHLSISCLTAIEN